MADKDYISEDEYIRLDLEDDRPNEYAYGKMTRREGRSLNHNFISGNILMALHPKLKDVDAFIFASLMRVFIEAMRIYRFPDVGVALGALELDDKKPESLLNPVVLVEILSDFTVDVDRIEKLDEYKQIPSLQEYIIIHQTEPRIQQYTRQDAITWIHKDVKGLDSQIKLASIGCVLKFSEVYRRITFERDE